MSSGKINDKLSIVSLKISYLRDMDFELFHYILNYDKSCTNVTNVIWGCLYNTWGYLSGKQQF